MAYDFGNQDIEENENLIDRTALCGSMIHRNPIPIINDEKIEYLLERGVVLLGAAGTGKTNVINLLNDFIDERSKEDSIKFIFDPKGDYLEEHLR